MLGNKARRWQRLILCAVRVDLSACVDFGARVIAQGNGAMARTKDQGKTKLKDPLDLNAKTAQSLGLKI